MKPKLKPIQNQVAVLLGATSGIGLETAMKMAEKDATVVIVGRSQEGLSDAVSQVRAHAETSRMIRRRTNGHTYPSAYPSTGMAGGSMGDVEAGGAPVSTMDAQIMSIEADVTDFEQVRAVADQVVQRFGRIDTWVNLAAVAEWALFEDTSAEEFRRIIEVNLIGQAYGAMAALPYMKQQQGGSLIFVSSIAGRIPVPYQSAYNASKHGVIGLAETLRQELKHTGVPVNVSVILPASMNTPMFDKARTKLGVEPQPVPPLYDAKLVSKAIVYAAQHPVRELIVGDSGYMMTFMRRLAPTITNNMMGSVGFRKQRSNEPKSAQAPDNLHHHLAGYNTAQGDLPVAKKFSPMTWLSTHPKARLGLMSAVIGAAGFLLGMKIVKARQAHRRSFRYRAAHFSSDTMEMLKGIGAALVSLPVISSLPMFQRKSFLQRVGDKVPFTHRRRSFSSRVKPITNKVKPLASQIKKLPRREKTFQQRVGAKVYDTRKNISRQVDHSRKAVGKQVEASRKAVSERVGDTIHTGQKLVSERMPRRVERTRDVHETVIIDRKKI